MANIEELFDCFDDPIGFETEDTKNPVVISTTEDGDKDRWVGTHAVIIFTVQIVPMSAE